MLFFAYDGSINGDWVSHYAARLATHHPEKRLHLVHVRDGQTSDGALEEKLGRIRAECGRLGVELRSRIELLARSVFETIRLTIEAGSDNYLICGTRVRERKRGLLSGTVSEKLLCLGHCNLLAVRVVQPGLLGCPRRLLLPVSGHPRGFRSGLPFLKLFGPDVLQMHILFVCRIPRWRFRLLSREGANQLRQPGEAYCGLVEHEISEQLGLGASIVDANAVVSDDVPKEIVLAANKMKSRLIYMGASERDLTDQFLYGNPQVSVQPDGLQACATDSVVLGSELETLREHQLVERLRSGATVFARTTPEQKMKIVTALKRLGHLVGMTGDGVNDASALAAVRSYQNTVNGYNKYKACRWQCEPFQNFSIFP